MNISRRKVVLAGGAVSLIAAVPLSQSLGKTDVIIRNYIERSVPDLNMRRRDLDSFARVAAQRLPVPPHKRRAHLVLMQQRLLNAAASPVSEPAQTRVEDWLITQFMRSTDYLLRTDPGQPTTYLGYADPYKRLCSNPLAKL